MLCGVSLNSLAVVVAMQVTSELLDRAVDEILDQIPDVCHGSIFTLDWWASE